MKKRIFISVTLLISSLFLKAQIYTPSGIIQGSSGNDNVGIGVTNPSEKLDVAGNIEIPSHNYYVKGGLFNYWGSCSADYGYYGMCLRYKNDQWESFHPSINGMAMRFIANGIQFITAPANTTPAITSALMTIKSNGNVAIYGKLEAKEIKVNLSPTADFVFSNNYRPLSLLEVENYINNNNHLPGIASANEMIINGVNIGEFQIKLLQKIEELTLYTIEQNKKIIELEKQNAKIKVLEEKIEKLESVSK